MNEHHAGPRGTASLSVALMVLMSVAAPAWPAEAAGMLSAEQLKQQLRPAPESAEDRYARLAQGDGDEPSARAARMPGADGSCEPAALRKIQALPSDKRNLVVVPAAPSPAPQATLNLHFTYEKYQLTRDDEAQLDQLAQALNDPELARGRYAIRGHTDSSGDAMKNLALSCARALEVRRYLVEVRHVAASRLSSFGFGSLRPIQPGNAADGANRRVEIRWLR